MTPETQPLAWLHHAPDRARDGVGFLGVESAQPLDSEVKVSEFLSTNANAVYLGHLTADLLDDPEKAVALLKRACIARKKGRALFASTPLSLPFLYGSATDEAEPEHLNVPKLVARSELAYLLETTCVTSFVPGTEGVAYLTPIEEQISNALMRVGIVARSQAPIGRRRVDFLVEDSETNLRLAIECDGAAFHDPVEDAARDRELEELGVRTIRFSGSAIFRDSDGCARKVEEAIRELRQVGSRESPEEHDGIVLSDQQMCAIRHRDGPARVAAPAGSGKTRVVDRRIRALVEGGVDPSRICAISFTNPAVDEMRERLARGGIECQFATVHKLAKTVAEAQFGKKTLIQGINPEWAPRVPSRWELLREILKPEERYMSRPRDFWTEAVNEFRLSFEVPDFEDWPSKAIPKKARFVDVCRQYDSLLRQRGLTDFEGWVHDALRALASDADFRSLWSGKFDYWIIDEYQDLPKAKLWLIRLLTAPSRNLFVVGDDDQVIYEFAGASSAIFAEFVEQFPDASEYVLETNYRSPHDLVVRSGWMIARNKTRVSKRVSPDRSLGATDRVKLSRFQEYDLVGEQFVRELLGSGTRPETIAVLFRLSDMALPLERLLREAGIPFKPCANQSYFNSTIVKAICAWLDLVGSRTTDPATVDLTLQWPNRYLKAEYRQLLINGLSEISDMSSLANTATRSARSNFDENGKRAVASWAASIRGVPDGTKPTEILSLLGLRELAKNDQAPIGRTSSVVLFDIFFRLAAQFTTVQGLLNWVRQNGDDRDYEPTVEEGVETTEGLVTLTTVHKAKGKEWDHVAVLGPPDGMPDSRAQSVESLEEERRIAYVAFTRARRSILFGGSLRYADELEKRSDGLSWTDYREGRTQPSQPNLRGLETWDPWAKKSRAGNLINPSRSGGNPDGSPEGSVKKMGLYILRPTAPTAEGEVTCKCGARLWADGVPPHTCPQCGTFEPAERLNSSKAD